MRAPWALRVAVRAASLAMGLGIAASSGCANILGLREAVDDGDCVLNSDCAPDKACIFRVCSPQCQADKDCPATARCLRTENGAACVDSLGARCDRTCPVGTVCDTSQNVCRNGCNVDADCLGGQVCTNRVCRGSDTGHDPPTIDGGGARDSSVDGTGSGGSSGTAGSGGSAGRGGSGASGGTAGASAGGSAGNAGAAGRGGSGGAAGAGTGGASGTGGTVGSGGAVGTGGAAGGSGGASGGGTGGTVIDGSTPDAPTDASTDRCVAQCTAGDTRCGVNQGVQTCVSMDGCLTWGTEVLCGGRKVCTGSAPTAACACAPRPTGCENGRGTFCADAATLVECAEDADLCIYKLTPVTCPASKPCTGSHPTASCSCTSPPTACMNQQGTFCESSTVVATCGLDTANCLAITNRVTCPSGKPCTGSFGSASCSCNAPPADCGGGAGNACRGAPPGEVVTCGTNSEGCVVITGATACTAGKPCAGTPPNSACTCPTPPVGCNQAGTNFCQSSTSIATCGLDGDGCLNITATSSCPSAKPCVNGVCTCPTPPAICTTAGTFCSDASTLVTCANDVNGCLGISSTIGCGTGKQCSGSAGSASCVCLPPPTDCPTGTGGTVCRAGNVLATCGPDPTTGCVVTTGTTTCTATKPCAGSYPAAACTCPAPPGGCTDPGMQNGTYCGNSTTAVTCTTTGEGCVNGSTTTCNAGQFCQQPYPMSACAAPVTLGYPTDIGATVSHGAGLLAGIPITTTNAVTLYRFGIFAKNTTGSQRVRMALYETNAGAPYNLVASSGHLTLANGNNLVAPAVSGIVLKAATTYYVMSVFETAVDVPHDATMSTTWHYIPLSYGLVFPPTLNNAMAGTTTTAQMSQSHIAYSIQVH